MVLTHYHHLGEIQLVFSPENDRRVNWFDCDTGGNIKLFGMSTDLQTVLSDRAASARSGDSSKMSVEEFERFIEAARNVFYERTGTTASHMMLMAYPQRTVRRRVVAHALPVTLVSGKVNKTLINMFRRVSMIGHISLCIDLSESNVRDLESSGAVNVLDRVIDLCAVESDNIHEPWYTNETINRDVIDSCEGHSLWSVRQLFFRDFVQELLLSTNKSCTVSASWYNQTVNIAVSSVV